MYCSGCGNRLDGSPLKCDRCGKAVRSVWVSKLTSGILLGVMLTFAALISGVLIMAGLFLAQQNSQSDQINSEHTSRNYERKYTPPPTPRPVIQIFNGSEVIGAGQSIWWSFSVGNEGANVTGDFSAAGGLQDEIECYITDESGKENIRRGLQSRVWYSSGTVNNARIEVPLGPGNYVLMFRNVSPWTQRVIRGRIRIQ